MECVRVCISLGKAVFLSFICGYVTYSEIEYLCIFLILYKNRLFMFIHCKNYNK